jgi:hypothetical protein
MLCKIWGFHGGFYEECLLLGYKNTVRTSQETHYVSTTQLNRLMLCNIWCFHGVVYEECRLLGYKNPVRTSQETHYVSTIQLSRLMLCKIWGFHDGDYEEWRLLGYKTPVRTSQETHYVSATESSLLMLYKIWGFHGSVYEEWRLLGFQEMSLVTGNDLPNTLILSVLILEAIQSSASIIRLFLHSVLRLLVRLTLLVPQFLPPWWWRHWVPPKRRLLQQQHSVTSQKTAFFDFKHTPINFVGTSLKRIYIFWYEVWWSEFLAADPEVPGLIPGAARFPE